MRRCCCLGARSISAPSAARRPAAAADFWIRLPSPGELLRGPTRSHRSPATAAATAAVAAGSRLSLRKLQASTQAVHCPVTSSLRIRPRPLTRPLSGSAAAPVAASSASASASDAAGQPNGAAPRAGKRTWRIAIVGAGPSGCYAAKYLRSGLRKQHESPASCSIDLLDRLPTLGGLVRYGVAPDHPEVKNVLNDFEALFEAASESSSSGSGSGSGGQTGTSKPPAVVPVRFYGNVRLGRDVRLEELRGLYDAVVLAYGCEASRSLGIAGESELEGVVSAREFVAWYNGHPDYGPVGDVVRKALRLPDAAESDSESPDGRVRDASAVVVGHGNVALDCARILAKGGAGLREGTDAAREAVRALGGGVERVAVVGRRGHVQAAFTIKEVRELVNLRRDGYGADFVVLESELDLGSGTDASREELGASRPRQRIDKLLRDAASVVPHRQPDSSTTTDGSPKQVSLRFLLNPVRFESDDDDEGATAGDGTATSRRLSRVVCERTRLVGDEAGKQRAEGTGQLEILPAELAIVSVGYRGEPVPGLEPFFDAARGTVRNDRGRVDGGSALGSGASARGALYVTGWLKRGPTGIIGTNIADAKETVASVLSDLAAARLETATTATDSEGEPEVEVEARDEGDDRGTALESLLASRGVHYVDWEGYRKIVKQESQDRRSEGQPREKITSLQRLLEVARS